VRAKHMLEEAEELAAVSLDKLTRECKTGEGIKCKGLLRTNQINEDAVRVRKADLARVPEIAAPKAGEQRIAAGLSYVFGGKPANYTEPVELFLPAMLGLTVELAALATAMFGWHSRKTANETFSKTFSESFSDEDQEPTPPRGTKRKTKTTPLPANVIQFKHPVVRALENVGKPVTNGELARLMGVSDGEASKRWREVAHMLEVARAGKECRISLKRVA
jgi:hypothetical protein